MHLAYLILTVFLGQLLGKSWLFPKAPFFLLFLPAKPQQPYQDHVGKYQ